MLNLSCCVETTNRFIIENQNGEYRDFCDYEKIFQNNKEIQGLSFEFIHHCQPNYKVFLAPREVRIEKKTLIINNRLLKVKKEDRKIRLHYLYKIDGKEHKWTSEWIIFK